MDKNFTELIALVKAATAEAKAARTAKVAKYAKQHGITDLAEAARRMEKDAHNLLNKKHQAAYRARHHADMLAARQVSYALMCLRARNAYDSPERAETNIALVAAKLAAFLDRDELEALHDALSDRLERRRSDLKPAG